MTSTYRPRVVLADDHDGMMHKVVELLAKKYDVVAAVNNGTKAIQAAAIHKPDVVILDVAMPERNGMQAAKELKRLGSKAKIVFLTVQDDLEHIRAACALGASYVLKSRMSSDLCLAIEEARAGRLFVSPNSSTMKLAADPAF